MSLLTMLNDEIANLIIWLLNRSNLSPFLPHSLSQKRGSKKGSIDVEKITCVETVVREKSSP